MNVQRFFIGSISSLGVVFLLGSCGPQDLQKQIGKKTFSLGSNYAGFDTATYPGTATMQWLWSNTTLYYTGFYLGGSNYLGGRGNPSTWLARYNELKDMGWGFVPVYVGSQSYSAPAKKTAVQGTIDAQDAVDLAAHQSGSGFPLGSVLYLDLEGGTRFGTDMLEYYRAWVQEVINEGYTPGVYCSYRTANQLQAIDSRPVFWVVQVNDYTCSDFAAPLTRYPARDPAESGVSYASVWQLAIDCSRINTGGHKSSSFAIDVDSANSRDPSVGVAPPSPSLPSIPSLISPVSPFFPASYVTVNGDPVSFEWSVGSGVDYYSSRLFVWNGSAWDLTGPFTMWGSPGSLWGITGSRFCAWQIAACNVIGCSDWSEYGYFYYQGP